MTRIKKNLKFLHSKVSDKVKKELDDGFKLLNSIEQPMVTFLGSHVTKSSEPDYKHAVKLATMLGKKGYGIVTGGGPGIMRAANQGATKAGAPSIGIRAGLITGEDVTPEYFSHAASYDYLFVRRFLLSIKSEALIFYPGGYGTLNELFEYVVLIETKMVDRVPLICVNTSYWEGLFRWLKRGPLRKGLFSNNMKDVELLSILDKHKDIITIIDEEDALLHK